jgi:hypothetical protein
VSLDTGTEAEASAAGRGAPAPEPPATPPAGPPSPGVRRLAWACVALALLPIVVAAIRAIAGDWVAVGDNAYFAIRARDVLTEHHPLLGTWTSASLTVGLDMNNPGPLLFDALALPVKLGGDTGLAIGVAIVNVVSVLGIAVAARRQAGLRGVVAAMAAATALGWAIGSELLVDPWQPHSLLLPVLCYLVLAWGLTCGDVVLLPWVAGLASFVVQTHIGYAVIVPVLGLWGIGVLAARLWSERRAGGPGWAQRRRQLTRTVVITVVVVVLAWSQTLYEQFFADGRGNLGRLASGVGASQETVGLGGSPRYVAEILALPPWWGRPSARDALAADSLLPSLAASIAGLVVVAAVLAAGVALGHRRGDRPGAMAAATGLVVLVVSVGAAATMPVGVLGVAAHHLRWLWPVSIFVTFAALLPLVTVPGRGRAARAGLGLVAAGTLVLALASVPAWNAEVGPAGDADSAPAIRALRPQLTALEDEPGLLMEVRGLRFAEPFSVPVVSELQRLGVPWYVDDPGMVRQLGEARRYEGQPARRLIFREGDAAREVPPGEERVAFVEGLTPAEADELADLQDRLRPFIEDGGLALDDHARQVGRDFYDPDAGLLVDGYLSDADHLFEWGSASSVTTGVAGTARASRYQRLLVYLVEDDFLDVPEEWADRLDRYADLQQQADRLTIGVFTAPLEEAG